MQTVSKPPLDFKLMSEEDFVQWVRGELKAAKLMFPDLFWRRVYTKPLRMKGGGKAKNPNIGFTDLLLARRGVVVFTEVKRPDGSGRLSPEQLEFKGDVEAAGLLWRQLSDPEHLVDVLKLLGIQWKTYSVI